MNVFTSYPTSVGQTYTEHLNFALRIGAEMIYAGCCCLIHALCPLIYTHTTSNIVSAVQKRIECRRLLMERENEDENK